MENTKKIKKASLFNRFIAFVERNGNKLPHPFFLFLSLIVVVIILSIVFSSMGASATYMKASSIAGEAEEEVNVVVKNLLSKDILRYLFQNLDTIYFSFSPMKMMVLLMLAIGLAEQVGLFETFIKRTIMGAPSFMIMAIVACVAINANTASNAGILGTTAVAAAVFKSLGYNPWLGIILGYAAGNAGMSANFFVGNLDVLMSGITQSVTTQLGIQAPVHVLMHWYFLGTAAIVLTIVFTIVTEKFMKGYIGGPIGNLSSNADGKTSIAPIELKALKAAGITALVFFGILIIMVLPKNSFFRADNGAIFPTSPLMTSILSLLFLFFIIVGIVYGKVNGKIKTWSDIPKILAKSLDAVLGFIVIALPASVFIHLFNASNMPIVLGVKGAEIIKSMNMNGFAILLCIAVFTAFLNLFMTSGSAKWMILAPILIPMFYAIGFSPALTSIAYRIGDSATNAIAPISTDIALIIGLLEKYKTDDSKKVGMGTVISLCLPYAIASFVTFIILLGIWYVFKLPLGPGVTMFIGK